MVAVLNNESPDACPYWNDKHVETLNNSLSTYEFEAPLQHASSEHIIADNYVARADMDGDYIFFKIKVVNEALSNGVYTKRAYCENGAIAELNGAFIRPTTMTGWSAEDALDYVLDGTMWNRGECDFLGAETLDFQDYPTSLSALHTIATVFGGELKYRVEIRKNVLYRYIDLVESRGTDTGKRFEYHKDINGLTRTEDSSNLATALIGLGKADANGKRMTFASINDGLDWVGDDDALDRYGQNGYHIFGVYESEYAENPVDLLALTKVELARRKKPFVTYDIDVILLETLADWSHEAVRLGDTVRVLDLTFTPEVVLAARIVSLERSYIDHTKDRAILGEFVPLALTVPSIVKKMQKTLVSNTGILEGREPMIHVDVTPPTNLDQKWMDTSVVPNILKRYDTATSTWVPAGGEQGPPGADGPAGPQGDPAYSVVISSSNGSVFKGGDISTTLTATVYKGGVDITSTIPDTNVIWRKRDAVGLLDPNFGGTGINYKTGKFINVGSGDVILKATFDVEVL